LIALQEPWVT